MAPYVTLYPPESVGRVNLNTASSVTIQALDERITPVMAVDLLAGRPYRRIQDVDRVRSFESIAKELRLVQAYDVKSNYFSVRMTIRVHEVTKYAQVVLLRDETKGTSRPVYFRVE